MRALGTIALATSAVVALGSPPSNAEIGVPAKVGGIYLSFEGGYQSFDGSNVAAFGDSTVINGAPIGAAACSSRAPGNPASCGSSAGTESATSYSDGGPFVKADEGAYGAFTFGYVMPSALFGFINRFEAVGSFSNSDDELRTNGALGFRSVDNTTSFAMVSIPIESLPVTSEQKVENREIVLRFKSDMGNVAGNLVTFSVEPFYMRSEQKTSTEGTATFVNTFFASASRTSDVDADYYGAQLALEGQTPLGTNLFLVGRGSAGFYRVETDGAFADTINDFLGTFPHSVSDSDGRTGTRAGGELGVRMMMTPGAWLTFLGGVNWLSDVPTAVLPRFQTDDKAHVEFDDQTTWHAGVRLTLSTSSQE